MATTTKDKLGDENNDSRSGLSIKSHHTNLTEPTANDDDSESSFEDLDASGLDELEKDLLNWVEERVSSNSSNLSSSSCHGRMARERNSSSSTHSRQISPKPCRSPRRVRSPMRSTKGKMFRSKSAKDIMSQRESQKVFQSRLRKAMTLNSYEQEMKKEECDSEDEGPKSQHPEECMKLFLQGISADTFKSETWETYFTGVTPERIAAHKTWVPKAIRAGDLDKLREMHASGIPLDGCNKHGESIISLACRLGKFEIVKFLVEEARTSVRVRDSSGRTPLHDACWTANPNFELIRFILNLSPELLFITDHRGFTAMRYIPQSCWPAWCKFIEESFSFLRFKISHSEFLSAHCKLDDAQGRLQALMKRAASYAAQTSNS